ALVVGDRPGYSVDQVGRCEDADGLVEIEGEHVNATPQLALGRGGINAGARCVKVGRVDAEGARPERVDSLTGCDLNHSHESATCDLRGQRATLRRHFTPPFARMSP